MKVLTIKQPWATLIMQRDKRFEFRSWNTNYRGELLIHAGKGIDKEAVIKLKKYLPEDLPKGKILGKVKIVDCIKCDERFKKMCQLENKDIYAKSTFDESFAWQIDNVKILKEPIEINGQLGLWNYELDERGETYAD